MFNRRRDVDFANLTKQLEEFYNEIHGEFFWEPEAQDAMLHWFNDEKMAPVPNYGRLTNYLGRRNEHLMKLSMISAISANHGLTVTVSDFRRAQQWLFNAEAVMPDVFRAMTQKSDVQILADTHHWMYTEYNKTAVDKRIPIAHSRVSKFLEDKVTSDKIERMIKTLELSGRIRKTAFGGDWIPNNISPTMESGGS
jgi:hypothetical protein